MKNSLDIRTVAVDRYITPLREGGSLPAVVEADDDFKYVLKFKGAGHGVKMLISEFIGGEVARKLEMKVPELVFATLDEAFGRTEPDEEIQDLLRASHGTNIGLHFLSGAVNFDPVVTDVDALTASRIVWLDAFLTNIDRTFRNTNMLIWNRELWLIDHGASLYFHHTWDNWKQNAASPFVYVKDHVLLPKATEMEAADEFCRERLSGQFLQDLVDNIHDEWLDWHDSDLNPSEIRSVYTEFLITRLENSGTFVKEAIDAKARL
jgi:hypothetical protein